MTSARRSVDVFRSGANCEGDLFIFIGYHKKPPLRLE